MNGILTFAITNPVVILLPAVSFFLAKLLVRVKGRRVSRKVAALPERRAEALHTAVVRDTWTLENEFTLEQCENTRFAVSLESAFVSASALALLEQLKTASTKRQRQLTREHLRFLHNRWESLCEVASNDRDFYEAAGYASRVLWPRIMKQAHLSLRGAPFAERGLESDIHQLSEFLADFGERIGKDAAGVPYSFNPRAFDPSRAAWNARDSEAGPQAAPFRAGF
jgi:hypothetical protein